MKIQVKDKNKVIKSEIKDALKDLKSTQMEQYVPDSLSLLDVKNSLELAIANEKKKASLSQILSLNKKETLSTVYSQLGLPDRISTGKGLGFDKKKTYIQAKYDSAGSVLLCIGKKKKRNRKAP